MPLTRITIPPGITRPGTKYDARGRWYDSDLIRWHEGALQPVKGWAALVAAGAGAVGGVVRGMLLWKLNNGTAYVAMGTPTALKVYSAGTLSDITPAALTAGAVDASGSYYARVEANSWQMDAFGEDLIACSYADGRIVLWNSSSGVGTPAGVLTGAPTGCSGVVVTPERFIVALGATGDGHYLKWSDQEDPTDWTPTATNQSGDFTLSGSGELMAGRGGKGETLLWTDADLWRMRYIGGVLVYSITRIADRCGAISRRSMAVIDGRAVWMGARQFYAYDGFVKPMPCEVGDYVFNRLNRAQASKVACVVNSDFNEVWWFYPSTDGAGENDSYVKVNYVTMAWDIGTLARSDGVDRMYLQYPIWAGTDGTMYEHENGDVYTDVGGGVYTPFLESGPVEIADGDQTVDAVQFVPDEASLGAVQTHLYTSFYPTAAETTHGPFAHTEPTDIRVTGRWVRLKHSQVNGGWRVGTPRLDIRPGSRR